MAGRKHRPEEIIGNPRSQKIQRQIAEIDTVRQKQRFSPEFKKWRRCPCGTEAAHLISYLYRSAARKLASYSQHMFILIGLDPFSMRLVVAPDGERHSQQVRFEDLRFLSQHNHTKA